ncbi:DUF3830 family protein [Streptomyces griseoloalbus]|uniref:DUF3830 family protein n=1 Tax=Streptomyces griseoloalbus TaxID=67303 RepID=A0ABV3EAD0_9ACTN
MAERYLEISLVKRGITCTARLLGDRAPITCAAVRKSLPLSGDVGWVPGIVWGQVVEGLGAMAEGCNDLWRTGAAGETLSFRRV